MALRTKPVRVLDTDLAALKMVASVEGRQPAQVIHEALGEYLENHRSHLMEVFAKAQNATASGNLDALTELLAPSAANHADALTADIDSYR